MRTKKLKPNEKKCDNCYKAARKIKNKDGTFFYKRLCNTCEKKLWRAKYPMKAAYQTLRHNSTRRKILFDLTFEQFEEFCYETDYMAGKGKTSTSYSIDRIIDALGYTYGNLQKLPVGMNSRKEQLRRQNKQLIYDWPSKSFTVISHTGLPETDSEDNPF